MIPNSCQSIGSEAFRNCSALENITLGNGLTSIGGRAFAGTKYYNDATGFVIVDGWILETKDKTITSAELPVSIYGIADGAFQNCKELADDTDFTGVKYIGEYAFSGCEAMWYANFDNALLTIGKFAFNRCSNLSSVSVGNSLQSIGAFAFYDCGKYTLQDLKLPTSLKHIGQDAFKKTYAYNATEGMMYVDKWLVGCNVPEGMGFLEIVVEDGTRGIADYALYGVMALTVIAMPDTVEYIGMGAFYENMLVSRIILPKNLKEIGDYAFYGCSGAWFVYLDDINGDGITRLPECTERIGRSAFYNCAIMVGLEIPGTVKSIGDYAFYGCSNLGESNLYIESEDINEEPQQLIGYVRIGYGVETIGNRAFQGCGSIVSVQIPETVTSMGIRVFYKCTKLSKVVIDSPLQQLPDYTFYDCQQLQTVTLPTGLQNIGKYAFRGCTALEEINLPEGLVKIDRFAFFSCSSLKEIVLPTTLKTLGDYALRGCSNVASVVIPAGVTEIGKHALHGMTKATIYCEATELPAYWHIRWNTSYRPVIWGATLSEDKTYVVSFVKSDSTVDNLSSTVPMTNPYHVGYVFEGFMAQDASGQEVKVDAEAIVALPNGTKVSILWKQDAEA